MALIDTVREIETPEGVSLGLTLAGPAARCLAWLLDFAIRVAAYTLIGIALSFMGNFGTGLAYIFFFLVEWFYPVAFEVFHKGQTPGKRFFKLAVVREDGTPVGWSESLLRNLMRTVDILPGVYLFGLVACLTSARFQRVGDVVAGTVVVYRDNETVQVPELSNYQLKPPAFPMLIEEQRAVIGFAERADRLSRQRLEELAEIVTPITQREGEKGIDELLGYAGWLVGKRR